MFNIPFQSRSRKYNFLVDIVALRRIGYVGGKVFSPQQKCIKVEQITTCCARTMPSFILVKGSSHQRGLLQAPCSGDYANPDCKIDCT